MFEESVSIWASMNSWFTPTVLFVLLNLMIGTILFSSNLSTQEHQEKHQEKQEDHGSNNQNDQQNPKLCRSPSVLQRIKSINFRNFRSQEASLFKQTLDSNTSEHFNQELQSAIETQTRYIFEETIHHETLTTQTQFVFEETHEEKSPLTQTHETDEDELEDGEPQSLDEVYRQLGKPTDSNFNRTTSDTKPASGEVPAKLPTKMKKSASMKSPFAHFEESDIVETRRPATVREKSAKATEPDEEVDAKADDFINKFKQQLKLQKMDSIIRYKEEISRGGAK